MLTYHINFAKLNCLHLCTQSKLYTYIITAIPKCIYIYIVIIQLQPQSKYTVYYLVFKAAQSLSLERIVILRKQLYIHGHYCSNQVVTSFCAYVYIGVHVVSKNTISQGICIQQYVCFIVSYMDSQENKMDMYNRHISFLFVCFMFYNIIFGWESHSAVYEWNTYDMLSSSLQYTALSEKTR